MSPRPAPTRHDKLAMVFLDAAAQLIDASLSPRLEVPRIKALHYPVALDWIRIQDVVRYARTANATASRTALLNRWAVRDEFIRDALVHALYYRDQPESDPARRDMGLAFITGEEFSKTVGDVLSDMAHSLLVHPRSALLAHIAPLLPRHEEIAIGIQSASRAGHAAWTQGYSEVLQMLGLRLRPDWPAERMSMALQLILDGSLVRARAEESTPEPTRWEIGSVCVDAMLAVITSAIDTEGDQRDMRTWLDDKVSILRSGAQASDG